MLKRAVVALVASVALMIGALPAAAHHTHSPTTLCSAYRPANYTMLTPHSHYDRSGHPITAHCYYRSNITFGQIQTCRRYIDHASVPVSSGCPHG